jgi:O-antigen/teichoic acid export membrane protein
MTFLRNSTETLIIGMLLYEHHTGIFKAAQKLSSLTSITLLSTLVIGAPSFANLYRKKDFTGLKKAVQNSTAIVTFTSLPIFLFSILFPDWLLHLFGNDFTEAKYALLIMCLGQFINVAFGPVNNLLMMTHHEKEVLIVITITNIICLVLDFLLIPEFGILAAAFVNLIGNILLNLIPFFIVKKKLGFYTISLNAFKK